MQNLCKMSFNCVLLLLIGFQFCSEAFVISMSPPSEETFDSTIEHFRSVFTSFPCSNKTIVNQIFNTMNLALNPKFAHCAERDAAKIDWLYLMVIGNNSNVSPERWKDILNKTIDAYSQKSRKIRREKLTVNEQMLAIYLLPSQIQRFNLYLSEVEKQMISSDLETFNRYFFGFPIGLALGVPEEDIAELLEDDSYGDHALDYLGRLANLVCESRYPNSTGHRNNQNLIRDLRLALEALLNRSRQA